MYKCQVTNRVSAPYEKLNKIVVETRAKTYCHWDEEAEENWETVGHETVKEINASAYGVELWNSWGPEQRTLFLQRLKG